ncbi:MAG: winged helix-turn-helix domain-containing protein [Dokdonella sp.]|uniref:winged helix-turn-helix domain-containing protein n=1 Tax=Dokdonella sp. TaxID=2291710 RepID=UPI00326302C9
MSVPTRYRTGEFLIDLDAREIRHGDERVDLEAKAFDLIALLLAGRERALSKRELNDALWPDRPVTDAALSQQLRKARRALGDDGDAQAVIRTVHGRGLRWVAPIELVAPAGLLPVSTSPSPHESPTPDAQERARVPTGKTRVLVAAVMLVAALVVVAAVFASYSWRAGIVPGADPRIAVLPVVDLTGDPALAWTSTGLMGLMASLLEQQGGIEVVPSPQVLGMHASVNASDAGTLQRQRTALGASHVIVAQLRRLGPIYQLEMRLVAGGGAERRESLHGSDPASLAADAVGRVRRWMSLQPPAPADAAAIGAAGPFVSEAYARGLDAQLRGAAADAIRYFSICLDHDPDLAWPRLGLAAAQAQSGASELAAKNATIVAAAAREQGDGELLVPALRQLASLAFFRGDLDEAMVLLDEALGHVSETEHPLALVDLLIAYGSIDDERGNSAKSRDQFERALKIARASANRRGEASVLVNLASLDNAAGNVAGASAALRAGLDAARIAGDTHLERATLGNLGATEANEGRLLTAITLLKQCLALAREAHDRDLQALATSQLVWALAPFARTSVVEALAHGMLDAGESAHNPYWQAEAESAMAGLAMRAKDWPHALRFIESARARYATAGMTRSVGETLLQTVDAATQAGNPGAAQSAAIQLRELAARGTDATYWRTWLPLVDAQLRSAAGEAAGATDDLAHALDQFRGVNGPAAQASLFQLGRWQIALERSNDLLARPEWSRWLEQDPDAIVLRIAALRATARIDDADAEQRRLDTLLAAPELAIDSAWLVAF